MTLGSLFDGLGGWLIAAKHAGIEPLWSSEIDPRPATVSAYHFPEVVQLGDVTKIDGAKIPPVDIITSGSPCQSLSLAGTRTGLKGESRLFYEATRVFREMRAATNGALPRFFVWENVPGTFVSNGGQDFRAVLEEIAETQIPIPKSGKWANAGLARGGGCDIAWRVLNAQYFGVPQRRKRIFLVADFAADNRCADKVLFEPDGVQVDNPQGGKAGQGATARACEGTKSAGTLTSWDNQFQRVYDERGTRTTLTANAHGPDNQSVLQKSAGFLTNNSAAARGVGYARELSPCIRTDNREAVLTGWDNQARRIYGEAAVASTLAARGRAGQNQQAVLQNTVYDITHASEVRPCVGKSPTLAARMGTGGNQIPITRAYAFDSLSSNSMKSANPHSGVHATETAKTLDTSTPDASKNQGGICVHSLQGSGETSLNSNGNGYSKDVSYTLNTLDKHGVAYGLDRAAVCGSAYNPVVSAEQSPPLCAKGESGVNACGIVRKLTPIECERLQGLEDQYTLVDFGGKPMSDSARYKMIGNGMAQPCADFVLEGIAREVMAWKR